MITDLTLTTQGEIRLGEVIRESADDTKTIDWMFDARHSETDIQFMHFSDTTQHDEPPPEKTSLKLYAYNVKHDHSHREFVPSIGVFLSRNDLQTLRSYIDFILSLKDE